MAGQRNPGPICVTKSWPIDDGTARRATSWPPGPVGVEPAFYPGQVFALLGDTRETMWCNDSFPPTPLRPRFGLPEAHRDEITPIAEYIVAEMNTNARSGEVQHMAAMNNYSAEACITDYRALPLWKQLLGLGIQPNQCLDMQFSYRAAALIAWGIKVQQNGEWDHKPKVAARFNARSPGGLQHWHVYDNTLYYYDVWSNMHYGYVGRAAGFSESVLLDGAGLEQIASTLLRLKIPQKSSKLSGLRAWDDLHDRTAIMMGIELYRQAPGSVTTQDVILQVVSSNVILKKPASF